MKTAAASIDHWTAMCRRQLRGSFIKRAGGVEGDIPFEQAFANLASAYLKDKAPGIIPHALGFQLLEKNEDNDKAVGVFGFQVGRQLMYAPVFFLNGELKGHELLYLKDSDTFVPMAENWINYVLNRKPNILGEETGPNVRDLGVERPSMGIFRSSPSKYASAQEPWLQAGLPGLAHALTHHERPPLRVPELIKSSAAASLALLQLIDGAPTLAKTIVSVYGVELLKTAVDNARTLQSVMPLRPTCEPRKIIRGSVVPEKTAADQNPLRTGELQIHTYNPDKPCPATLTSKQAQNLQRDGIYIKDDRETASRIYRVQEPLTMQNPTETGIFDVLIHPDKFEKLLVIVGPHTGRGQKPGAVAIRTEDSSTKRWQQCHPGDIFVAATHPPAYKEWFDGLPDATSLEVGAVYALIAPGGNGTSVFEVEKSCPAEGEEKCYEIWWRGSYDMRRPDHLPPVAESRYEYDNDRNGVEMISLNRIKGGRIISRHDTMYIPPGTKAIKLKNSDPDRLPPCPTEDSSDPPPIRLGRHVDLQLGIYKISSELKVFSDGTEAVINNRRMPAKAGLMHLVAEHGLREKAARELLGEAARKQGVKCRIKYAQPYEMIRSAPSAPSWPAAQVGQDTYFNSGVPAQEFQEEDIPVDLHGAGNNEETYNAARPVDPQSQQFVQQAAQTGQQEVLDTSMLSSLLRSTRDDSMIDRYLGDLVKGLDRIGRLLFNFYWHNERFAERFGDNEIPELEDSLRNSFEGLGDLVLFLKQKSVDPYPEEATAVDLAPGADSF